LWCDASEWEAYMYKARSAENLINLTKELGRSWRASWVSGEGWVDRTGSYDESLGQVLLEGCDLGIPHKRYLWRVYWEENWGVGYPWWRCCRGTGNTVFSPGEDILSGPPKDWCVLRTGTMGPSCTPLAPDGRETITWLTRAVPLLLGWKVIV
jgi:hypothetical protein